MANILLIGINSLLNYILLKQKLYDSTIYIYICVCVCVCEEMVDFGKSDKMIKINGKMDKSNKEPEEVLPWIKNKILLLNPS